MANFIEKGILSLNPETGKIGPKLTRKNLERFKGPNDLIVDSKQNLTARPAVV